jgi:hypothetical protein
MLGVSPLLPGCGFSSDEGCVPMQWAHSPVASGESYRAALRDWYDRYGRQAGAPEPSSAWRFTRDSGGWGGAMSNGHWKIRIEPTTGAGPTPLSVTGLVCV